jgi:hypothetical protein
MIRGRPWTPCPAVFDAVFEIDQHAWLCAMVVFVNQNGPLTKEITVALQREIDERIQQGMPGATRAAVCWPGISGLSKQIRS